MQRPLTVHGAMPEPTTRSRPAIAAKGFRPFFFLASAFAALIVPLWLLIVNGVLAPRAYLDPSSWHAHEMIFGYTVAVIAGFLLTAVGNWTQRETIVGAPLLALAGLWTLGRVAMAVAPALPRGLAALVDLAFLPALALVLARPLIATQSRRNFVMLAVIAALFATNVAVHLDALGILPPGTARRASLVAIDVVVFLILVIAGRVVPMFTRNATGVTTISSSVPLERATVLASAALVVIDVARPETTLAGVAAGAVAIIAIARAVRWGALYTARHPLLWILHVGYAWIPIGLAMRALPLVGAPVASSFATHALTVGAIAAITLGMMSRVTLGHTGRPLVASRLAVASFVLVTTAALARVIVPLVYPAWYGASLLVSGAAWSVAFALYVVGDVSILFAPRPDGKPG
jgi:uncharacterized protein involved in response to NO